MLTYTMARKRKKKVNTEQFPKIHELVEQMKEPYEAIQAHTKKMEDRKKAEQESEGSDYKYWTIQIVQKLENEKYLDKEAYNNLVKKYPQTKYVVDSLVEQVELFSIYDDEPSTINFDYAAYLLQIKNLIEN